MSNPKHAASPLSRRTFLHGSALAAATTTPIIAGARRPSPATDDPDVLKVGLIGCGGRGTGAAMQALSAEDGTVVLHAVSDAFPERIASSLQNLKNGLGEERADRLRVTPETTFPGLEGYKQVIASGVDVVILATPPHFRPLHLAAVAEAGLHCFCEKPVAVDAPGYRSVLESVELFRQKQKKLSSGFCWRYNVRNRALYERVLDGAIGDVNAVYSTYLTGPLRHKTRNEGEDDVTYQIRNWYPHLWMSGDHLVEQAVHSIDKQQWAYADATPVSAVAVGGRQGRSDDPIDGNIWDHFSITYDYGEGRRGFHTCRQIANCSGDNNDYLYGSKGRAIVEGWAPNYEIVGENAWYYEGEGNEMYQQEHDDLFAAIRSGAEKNDGVWMANTTMTAILGRMAAYTGQVITWEQAIQSQERLGPVSYEPGELAVAPPAVPGRTKFL